MALVGPLYLLHRFRLLLLRLPKLVVSELRRRRLVGIECPPYVPYRVPYLGVLPPCRLPFGGLSLGDYHVGYPVELPH